MADLEPRIAGPCPPSPQDIEVTVRTGGKASRVGPAPFRRAFVWLESEDAILRGLGTDIAGRSAAARQLGRSREAVDGRMAKLGLLAPRKRRGDR
jgi:hypothetical protein